MATRPGSVVQRRVRIPDTEAGEKGREGETLGVFRVPPQTYRLPFDVMSRVGMRGGRELTGTRVSQFSKSPRPLCPVFLSAQAFHSGGF